jgi:hypothetical protein
MPKYDSTNKYYEAPSHHNRLYQICNVIKVFVQFEKSKMGWKYVPNV